MVDTIRNGWRWYVIGHHQIFSYKHTHTHTDIFGWKIAIQHTYIAHEHMNRFKFYVVISYMYITMERIHSMWINLPASSQRMWYNFLFLLRSTFLALLFASNPRLLPSHYVIKERWRARRKWRKENSISRKMRERDANVDGNGRAYYSENEQKKWWRKIENYEKRTASVYDSRLLLTPNQRRKKSIFLKIVCVFVPFSLNT